MIREVADKCILIQENIRLPNVNHIWIEFSPLKEIK